MADVTNLKFLKGTEMEYNASSKNEGTFYYTEKNLYLGAKNLTPEALKNPKALKITGSSAVTYDGSQEVSLEMPSVYTGAKAGIVPERDEGATTNKYLCEDGKWASPPTAITMTIDKNVMTITCANTDTIKAEVTQSESCLAFTVLS